MIANSLPKLPSLASLAALALLVAVGCSPQASDDANEAEGFHATVSGEQGVLTFDIQTEQPLVEGQNDLTLAVRREGATVTDLNVTALVEMPAMTHGQSEATVVDAGDGTFVLEGVDLSMPGDWYITLYAESDQLSDSANVWLEVP